VGHDVAVGSPGRSLLVAAVLVAACADDRPDGASGNEPTATPTSTTSTTSTTTSVPPSAGDLGVVLDPDGRPFDAQHAADLTTSTELLGRLAVPDGQLRIMDGNALEVSPSFFADEATNLDLGDVESVDAHVVWIWRHDHSSRTPVGIRLDLDEGPVARWGPFEHAYGTDGGVGGITSQAVIERSEDMASDPFVAIDHRQVLHVLDLDGAPGDDSIIFFNSHGDGAFPLTRGFDEDGELASVVVWAPIYPWRLAISDGTPPQDVTRREDELAACLDGSRPLDAHGECPSGA
jgi:hypothetical protein